MSTYTVEQLRNSGPPFAMAMLMRCLNSGEPIVTYSAIRNELEHQLGIKRIFSTQIGHVAGSLMTLIHKVEPSAPLINALITRPDGIPGVGVGNFFADKYKDERYRNWEYITKEEKLDIVNRERNIIFQYTKWNEIIVKLFGTENLPNLRELKGSEEDGRSKNGKIHSGPSESKEHKNLKEWVASNPQAIGIRKSFGKGTTESQLLSGDTIDVLFVKGNEYVVVEVKSCRSNDEDFRRGIYQCVKYKTVKQAEQLPNKIHVQAFLITERRLSTELAIRARLLNVRFKHVLINKKFSQNK